MKFRILILLAGLLSTGLASAQEQCLGLIELSKLTSSQVKDEESFFALANNYCEENERRRTNSSIGSAGLSYGPFSASGSKANASDSLDHSSVCHAEKKDEASKGAYRSYVQTIAPGAYAAYEACISQAERGFYVSVQPVQVLEHEFSIPISLRNHSFPPLLLSCIGILIFLVPPIGDACGEDDFTLAEEKIE